ncbi:uncharacterized protein EI97DRAFT_182180 [Westerdykella ornata]|uniref:Uncharacterized protein n=1 Tax=Westerdykella ornata TaxID=318751 RepID=A0A6A6JTR8_WESOR|nr:uncharacterized protein EI97DRAFT_182180 [Westerdykella ornata]KAF2279634.1 hypothetical protein EI97DRAFT_182180 [Westerdykella ornata]
MLQTRITAPIRRVVTAKPSLCIRCQRRVLTLPGFLLPLRPFATTTTFRRPANSSEELKDDEPEFIPQPLGRPIGFPNPPKPGQSIGREKKTYTGATMLDRNLEKRKDLVKEWQQNYFRDLKNVRKYRKGKTFMANPRIFKKEAALYFPNFHGETLAEREADTTPILNGKISVVNIFGTLWGEEQTQSFTGKKENPELRRLLEENKDIAQMVDLNVEENTMKAWIVAIFRWKLRRQRPEEDWNKYFVIRRGVSDVIREKIGLLNGRVGYVYLLDENCKIRWAGSADAEGTEKEDLTRGAQRLIQEYRTFLARVEDLKRQR